MKKLFVGNIPHSTTEAELRTLFESHGKIDQVSIVTDRDTGRSRGFAFVEMSDAAEAEKAIAALNGKELGEPWHAPYRVEVTSALKPGANEITIKVVNAWVNRLIGDEQPGATKITFADVKPYKAESPLLPSGLLGPVTVVREERP